MTTQLDRFVVSFDGDTRRLESSMERLQGLSDNFAASLARGFEDVAVRGRSLADVVNNIALSLSRASLRAALKPVEDGLGSALGAIAPALSGVFANALPALGFAKGGVLSSPHIAGLPGPRLGVMGEAGPEAVLPLARGADGRLGVRSGAGGAPVQITFNVTTPDAASFARSQAQVSTMLARAVERGRRGL